MTSGLLIREKEGIEWKKSGGMSMFEVVTPLYVIFMPPRAHRRDPQMIDLGPYIGFEVKRCVASLIAL